MSRNAKILFGIQIAALSSGILFSLFTKRFDTAMAWAIALMWYVAPRTKGQPW